MFYYVPKLHHVIIAAILCIACLAIGSKIQSRVANAFYLGAFLFGFLFFIVVLLMFLEGWNRRVQVMVDFANAIANLDDEARAIMAFEFPHMRYKMKRGIVREMFEDTNVPMETFRLFLHLSNSKYISPRRDWFTQDKPQWAWLEIQEYLLQNNFIVPDSAAGSHSWLWNGNAWEHLNAYWGAGLHVREMRDMQVFTTTSPPMEDVRGSAD